MNADNLRKNAGRWVRVGVLTLTTLGPIINVVSSRLRERTQKLQQDTVKRGQETLTQSQRQLLSVGASLSDTLTELKSNPYSHELLKRGSELSGTLAEQGGRISHELAERSSKAAQELAKQSQRTTHEVSQRTQRAARQAQRELIRAGSQVREQATSPDYAARFWSICGFIVGLVSAIAGAYIFIRRRIQPNTPDTSAFQLSNHASLNGATSSTANAPLAKATANTAPSASVVAPEAPNAPRTSAPSTSNTPTVTPIQDTSTRDAPTTSTQDTSTQNTFSTPESLEGTETQQGVEALESPQISDAALENVVASEPQTVETPTPTTQDIQEVQDTPVLPDTLPDALPENTPSLNATAEPLTASPQSEGVVSTPTSDEGSLAVEVPVEDATTPAQQVQEPVETRPAETTNVVTEPEPFHTIETPASSERSYGMGNEAMAISTGMPVVSVDETIIPVEGLGTATVSGVVGDSTSPDVEQDTVSDALASTVEQVLNEQVAQSSSVAGPAILGVVSMKRYYPIETPLSSLRTPDGDELDIIYFANEDEAKAQGYTAAE